jgi:hypothetical protein
MRQQCDGKCISKKVQCNGKCNKDYPIACGDKCLNEKQSNHKYECNGECIAIEKPCNGTCNDKKSLLCGHICKGEQENCTIKVVECQKSQTKCGNKCLNKFNLKFYQDCNGQCISTTLQCNNTCNDYNPRKCGHSCQGKNNTYNRDLNGKCIPSYLFCDEKCLEGLPYQCEQDCKQNFVSNDLRCDGTKVPEGECPIICVNKKTYLEKYQDCDGKCIPKSHMCKGKCPKDKPIKCFDNCTGVTETCIGPNREDHQKYYSHNLYMRSLWHNKLQKKTNAAKRKRKGMMK